MKFYKVSEKLPEEGSFVLTYRRIDTTPVFRTLFYFVNGGGFAGWYDEHYFLYDGEREPLYWAENPEPPQDEKELELSIKANTALIRFAPFLVEELEAIKQLCLERPERDELLVSAIGLKAAAALAALLEGDDQ